jgi:hypothetical protein
MWGNGKIGKMGIYPAQVKIKMDFISLNSKFSLIFAPEKKLPKK